MQQQTKHWLGIYLSVRLISLFGGRDSTKHWTLLLLGLYTEEKQQKMRINQDDDDEDYEYYLLI
jgi:hypothetical protein